MRSLVDRSLAGGANYARERHLAGVQNIAPWLVRGAETTFCVMKNTPVQSSFVSRGPRCWVPALLVAGLCASVATAQSPSGAGASTESATTDRSSGSASSSGAISQPSGSTSTSRADNPSMSSSSRDMNGNASTLKRSDRRFLTKAQETNQREIAASNLAAQRATDPQIRSFAQQLSSEHMRMDQELMQLAQRKGVTLDTMGMTSSGQYSASSSRPTDSGMSGSTNSGIATDHGAPRATGAAGTAGTAASSGIAANSSTSTSNSADTASLPRTGSSTNSGIATDHGAPRATGAAGTAGTGASSGVVTNSSTATGDMAGAMSGAASAAADIAGDRHLRNLSQKSGQEFDREYVDLVVDAHEDAVRLFQRAAKEAQDSEVRSFASSHVAALQSHLDQANSLMRSAAE
jgi:predicted outer membrane protein